MKNRFKFLVCLMITLGFISPGNAEMREPMEGAGWHYSVGGGYSEWRPGNMKFDEKLFDQDVIAAYGWEAEDVDKIKDMISPALYRIMKNPDVWGTIRINVTAYRENTGFLWKRYVKATEKYKGTAKVDKVGWLRNYKAGCPFPEPKTGLEALWNFKKHFSEDDRILGAISVIVNRSGQERHQINNGDLMYFDGRLQIDPKPLYEPNPKNEFKVDVFAGIHPYEMRGTLSVITQFNNPDKEDAFWMYLPSLRRVRRLSSAQRTDRLPGGQVLMWENFDVFNGNPINYNCKLVEQKEMLAVHNGHPRGEWVEGAHMVGPNDYYQKVKVHIIEITPKDPDFPFSRMMLYVDSNTWMPYFGEWYDRENKLYIYSQFQYSPGKNGIFCAVCMNHVDMQAVHSSGAVSTNPKYNVGLTPAYFKEDNLRKEYPSR